MAQKDFDALEIINSIGSESEIDIIKAALVTLQAVVVSTPVGDPTLWQFPSAPPGYVGGHARRNWNVSIGSFSDEVKGSAGAGLGAGGASGEAIAQGRDRIQRFTIEKRRIIIQNNVPYIVPLNNGHSTQAPKNFVQAAVMAGTNSGRNDRKELP